MFLNTTNGIFRRAALPALLVLFFCLATGAHAESRWDGSIADPDQGDGSKDAPYIIDSAAKLAGLRNWILQGINVDKNYILTVDIDCKGRSWTPIGSTLDKRSRPFKGSFDGGGHVVANLRIQSIRTSDMGLFGYIEDARISNIGLVGIEIEGFDNIGLLVGRAERSTIEESFAFGRISGNRNVGGLAGSIAGTLVLDCFSGAAVSGLEPTTGGLVGLSNVSKDIVSRVEACFASGGTTGAKNNTGGLIGDNRALCEVENALAVGSVRNTTKEAYAGSLIGSSQNGSTISNVAFDSQGTGRNNPFAVGGSGATNILALSTSIFTNGTLPERLSSAHFIASRDSYPQLAIFFDHTRDAFRDASALAAVPIFLTAGSTSSSADGVVKTPVRDSAGNALFWNLPQGRGVFLDSDEPNRKILLLPHGATAFAVSNDERGGSKGFFASADVKRGIEIELTASADRACEAALRYNGVSLDRAVVHFVAAGSAATSAVSSDTATDGEGVARYALPSGMTPGSYDVYAAIPNTTWKSNLVTLRATATPKPEDPDDRDPSEPNDDTPPDVPPVVPDGPDNPSPGPDDITPPQPGSGDVTSGDETPAGNQGNCDAGAGAIALLPVIGIMVVAKRRKE